MLKKHLILIVCCCSLIHVKAESLPDALYLSCITRNGHDTDKIKCLDIKSYELSASNPRLGLKLAEIALSMSQKIKWQKGLALANNELAVNYEMLGDLDSAAYHYNMALKNFTEIGNVKAQSGVMTNISSVYKSRGNYAGALKMLDGALKIQDKHNMDHEKAITLENIGSVYLELKEFEKARIHYLKARSIYYRLKDNTSMARNLLNMGILFDKSGNYDSAVSNLMSALNINLAIDKLNSIQITYSNLGIVYMHMGDFNKAIQFHNKEIDYSRRINSEYSLATDYGNIGEAYMEKFKLEKITHYLGSAIDYLKKGYFLCQKIGFTPPQVEFGEKLIEALELEGKDYHLAFIVFKQKTHLKDSIYSADNRLKIHRLETENVIAQKENELKVSKLKNILAMEESEKHKQQMTILSLLAVSLGLIIGILYLLYINRNRFFRRTMHEISQFQSHQLRSPVAKIMSIVEALNKSDIDKTESDKLLEMLNDSANELDRRIHEIVDKSNPR